MYVNKGRLLFKYQPPAANLIELESIVIELDPIMIPAMLSWFRHLYTVIFCPSFFSSVVLTRL